MQIAIEMTPHIVTLDGVQCRVWQGVTAAGVPCKVFVHRLAVLRDLDCAEFERELAEQSPPGIPVPLRHVL